MFVPLPASRLAVDLARVLEPALVPLLTLPPVPVRLSVLVLVLAASLMLVLELMLVPLSGLPLVSALLAVLAAV